MSTLQAAHPALLRVAPALRDYGGSFSVLEGACRGCGGDVEMNGKTDWAHCEECFINTNLQIQVNIATGFAQAHGPAALALPPIPQQMNQQPVLGGYGMAGRASYQLPAHGQAPAIFFPPFNSQPNTAGHAASHLQSTAPAANLPLTLKVTNVAAARASSSILQRSSASRWLFHSTSSTFRSTIGRL